MAVHVAELCWRTLLTRTYRQCGALLTRLKVKCRAYFSALRIVFDALDASEYGVRLELLGRDLIEKAAMHRRTFLIAAFALPSTALAHSLKFGPIRIGHAWTLPAPSGDTQAFMPLLNQGEEPDAVIGASALVCERIELRLNGRYAEAAADSFAFEPGIPIAMRPGARHLRLIGLKRPLTPGFHFAITLDFLNLGLVDVEAFVEPRPGD